VYAINQVASGSLKRIYSTYRERFGIESSYRQSRQARICTSSRKPWFCLLIFVLSMMLRNLWLEVRWLLGERGGRKIAKALLPFPMFVRWLVWAVWKEGPTFQDLVVPSNGAAESIVGDSVNY
jgi:putative transposase